MTKLTSHSWYIILVVRMPVTQTARPSLTRYTRGVIQAALIEKNVAAPSTLAFVGSLAIACNAAFAIPNGRLTRALGARKVAVLGLLLMGTGQILSGFTDSNIAGLFITAGLLMGYGIRYVATTA